MKIFIEVLKDIFQDKSIFAESLREKIVYYVQNKGESALVQRFKSSKEKTHLLRLYFHVFQEPICSHLSQCFLVVDSICCRILKCIEKNESIGIKWVNPFQPSVDFYTKACHVFCRAIRMTSFYMKRNTMLKWVKVDIESAKLIHFSPVLHFIQKPVI